MKKILYILPFLTTPFLSASEEFKNKEQEDQVSGTTFSANRTREPNNSEPSENQVTETTFSANRTREPNNSEPSEDQVTETTFSANRTREPNSSETSEDPNDLISNFEGDLSCVHSFSVSKHQPSHFNSEESIQD